MAKSTLFRSDQIGSLGGEKTTNSVPMAIWDAQIPVFHTQALQNDTLAAYKCSDIQFYNEHTNA